MSIEVKGLDQLRRKLGDIKAIEILEPAMQDAVIRLEDRMKRYPPQRPTTYRRTGTLGRRWTSRVDKGSSSLTGVVGNNTRYGPFVQSKRFQARIHRGHWNNTDQNVLDEERDTIVRDFERAVAEAL